MRCRLRTQIVNDMIVKTRSSARLGEGKSTRERYFIVPFAYENKGNDPEFSHSFLSVIRILADSGSGTPADARFPLSALNIKRPPKFEAFTISWLPHDFY